MLWEFLGCEAVWHAVAPAHGRGHCSSSGGQKHREAGEQGGADKWGKNWAKESQL